MYILEILRGTYNLWLADDPNARQFDGPIAD